MAQTRFNFTGTVMFPKKDEKRPFVKADEFDEKDKNGKPTEWEKSNQNYECWQGQKLDFMGQVIYKIKDYSKDFLLKHKFKYSSYLSEYGDDVYTYKFPLIYSIKIPVIECEISVSAVTGVVNLNIYKAGTKELYPPYYDREYGNYKNILKLIDTKINRKLKELGIKKIWIWY